MSHVKLVESVRTLSICLLLEKERGIEHSSKPNFAYPSGTYVRLDEKRQTMIISHG